MTVRTEPLHIDGRVFHRFSCYWSERGSEFLVTSPIFSDDQSPVALAYLLGDFAAQVRSIAEHGPKPG